ncbi:SPFH domain-containing protein [Streptomyces sp. NBC_00234]|uniref:SPFH domain-containing protein n=1 Tax=Streptomyces sp. NBC_00234 TaxID=2903638 RepID=UPI002E2A5B1C|nr:SPFH domain-containing protein [Streptomyces sp. NBC_00234]
MRPTVSDSSGFPENGKAGQPVYGHENATEVPADTTTPPGAHPAPGILAEREAGAAPDGNRRSPEPEPELEADPDRAPEAEDGRDGHRAARPAPESGATPDPGSPADDPERGADTVVDLVLDLAPADTVVAPGGVTTAPVALPVRGSDGGPVVGAGPARNGSPDLVPGLVTVPGPGGRTGAAGVDTWWDTGRRHPVIANESTASIPVHLLFRDDRDGRDDRADGRDGNGRRDDRDPGADTEHYDPGTLPAFVTRRPPPVRRPPLPRSPQVQAPTRPAPLGDPRLAERPGPALPGWAALLTGAIGTAAGLATLWWSGALPDAVLSRIGIGSRPYDGIGIGAWALLAFLTTVVLFALGGLGRGRVGHAWVLTLFGDYRGSVRRTGLVWVSPLLLRRRVDVRLRHWRSEPLPAVDANGTALRVVVLVVWRIKDTVRATLGVADHEEYLREQVGAAMARVLSQLPADAFHEDAHTLRNAEAVGDALTRMLKADCEPVGIEVYSAQPTGIEYAPEVAAAMQRTRIAAIDAKHRDSVLTSVVDAVDDTVHRLTSRGIVELDDYERKALVKDLTVAFYTGRSGGDGA